jgi:IclR helix-turn-helix domain
VPTIRTDRPIDDAFAWAIPTLREVRYSQSLERGLAILGCFTPRHPVLGIADMANRLGMSRSTTHRYVITLQALGYLEQGASRKYRLGLRVTDLGMSALNSTGLREHAHPYLEELTPTHHLHHQPRNTRRHRPHLRRPRPQLAPRPRQDRPRPAHRLTTTRLLHSNGQATTREPPRHRAARADRANEAHQARAPTPSPARKPYATN